MNSLILKNALRFIILILLQGLFFISLGLNTPVLDRMNIIVYPLVLILLPLRTPRTLLILLGFVLGLALDFFYNTPGIHAATSVLTAFIRPYLLSWVEPRGGYQVESSPTASEFGFKWFFYYSAIFMAIHLFVLFSIQHFTFVYILEILLRTVVSFAGSMLFILVYILIFNPEE